MIKIFEKIKSVFAGLKPVEYVYVRIILDAPLQGISKDEPKPMERPWIKIKGLSFDDAALNLVGGSINWATVPHSIRRPLETGDFKLEIEWMELKKWVI